MTGRQTIPDPFVESRRYVDIFRRQKLNTDRLHLVCCGPAVAFILQNVGFLSTCVSQLGRIQPRHRTSLSSKTQRHLAKAIKRARHMGRFSRLAI